MSVPVMRHEPFDNIEHLRYMVRDMRPVDRDMPSMVKELLFLLELCSSENEELRLQNEELRSEKEELCSQKEELHSQNEELCFQIQQYDKQVLKLKDTVAYERKRVKQERAHNVDRFKKILHQEAKIRLFWGFVSEIRGMIDEPEDGPFDVGELPKTLNKARELKALWSPRRRRMHDGTALTCCPFSCSKASHRNVLSGHEQEEGEAGDEDDDDHSGCEPCCRCCIFRCGPSDDTPQHGHHPNDDVGDTGRSSSSGSGAEREEELVSDIVAAVPGSDPFEEVGSLLPSDSVEKTNDGEHQSMSGDGGLDSENHYDNNVDDSDPLVEGGTAVLQSDLVEESNDEEHQSKAGVGGLDSAHISSDNVVACSDPSAKEDTPVSHLDLAEEAKAEENQSMTGEGMDDDRETLIEMQDASAHREIEPDDHYDAEDELELSVGEEESMLEGVEQMKQHLPSLGHKDRKSLAGPDIANPPLEEILRDCPSHMSPMYRDTTTDEEDIRTLKPPRRKPRHSQTPAASYLATNMRDQVDQQAILWTPKQPVDTGSNAPPPELGEGDTSKTPKISEDKLLREVSRSRLKLGSGVIKIAFMGV
ncbi:hypothetical protein QBC37DRAFT_397356 [Rhypophila decipiens]|uniref:Uncharacterized protein n=1 Tax=Rhypophila decipiens TaxID=261697 RepID=A0AAN6YDT6_9PEZI|nr:hypothetical protein QBC37DRAFT_397356 [Rhypophila decipiens]